MLPARPWEVCSFASKSLQLSLDLRNMLFMAFSCFSTAFIKHSADSRILKVQISRRQEVVLDTDYAADEASVCASVEKWDECLLYVEGIERTRLQKVLEGPSWGKRFVSERGCCCLSRSVCLMPVESVLEKLRLFLPAEAKD